MAEKGTPERRFETAALLDGQLKFSTRSLKYQMDQLIKACSMPVKILLSGKTGAGKSHLTNALIGEQLAEEGEDVDPQTDQVTAYEFIKNNMKIRVFDTPGLADPLTSNNEKYLKKIKEKERDFDLFLFCTEMNCVRFRKDDLETIEKLTTTLGVQLWDHAVVVLTFANIFIVSQSDKVKGISKKDAFIKHFQSLQRKITEALVQCGVPEQAAKKVPFVPAGDSMEPRLPDRDDWMTAFWVTVFMRIGRNAQAAFLFSNADRITFSSSSDVDEDNHESAAIRSLEDDFQGVSSGKNLGTFRRRPRKLPKLPPQSQNAKRNAPSSINLDESSSRSIVQAMVGDVTNSFDGTEPTNRSTFVRFYQTFLSLIIKYLRKLFRSSSQMEACKREGPIQ